MPTPNTYDYDNFKTVIGSATNLFHQTNISNLPAILAQGVIYSPGTQWGVSPVSTTARYTVQNQAQRLANLKLYADRGFIDYVFCSFENGIQRQNNRYGVVSLEILPKILIERETFIYPFNFVFGWNAAPLADKFSDLSTWQFVISPRNRIPYNEVLIRRKIELGGNLVKFHCFQGVAAKVIAILDQFGYNGDVLEVHPNVTFNRRDMDTERLALIDGVEYKALVSADGKLASIYNVISDDDLDFLGRYALKGNELIEVYPMSRETKVIGVLKAEAANSRLGLA
jgi:hypothetical protein